MLAKAVIKNSSLGVIFTLVFSLLASVHVFAAAKSAATSKVLFSVRPLAILYVELTGLAVREEQVLVAAGKNLHDYHLSLSEIKRLNETSTVFWMGAENEVMLNDLSQEVRKGKWYAVASKPHQWLSWQDQIAFIQGYSQTLQAILPDRQSLIVAHEKALLTKLNASFTLWQQQVEKNKMKPILMAHEAFAPWVTDLSMPQPVYYSSGHSHGKAAQGGKQSLKIQQQIMKNEISCALEEPDAHFDQLEKKFPTLNTVLLEPMADSQSLMKGEWAAFWQYNWRQLSACMQLSQS